MSKTQTVKVVNCMYNSGTEWDIRRTAANHFFQPRNYASTYVIVHWQGHYYKMFYAGRRDMQSILSGVKLLETTSEIGKYHYGV